MKEIDSVEIRAVDILLAYVRQCDYGSRTHTMIEVTLETGCRVGTLREIDLCDVDLQAGTISLRTSKKNALPPQTYVVELSEYCIGVLEAYIEYDRMGDNNRDNEALLTSLHDRVSLSTIHRSVNSAVEEAWKYHIAQNENRGDDTLKKQIASLSLQDVRTNALNRL